MYIYIIYLIDISFNCSLKYLDKKWARLTLAHNGNSSEIYKGRSFKIMIKDIDQLTWHLAENRHSMDGSVPKMVFMDWFLVFHVSNDGLYINRVIPSCSIGLLNFPIKMEQSKFNYRLGVILTRTFRVSSHYWNYHNHNHFHKKFGQILYKFQTMLNIALPIGLQI